MDEARTAKGDQEMSEVDDPINRDGIARTDLFKPNNYMYKMIETMLPKAMVDENKKHIRLLEL